MENNLKYEFITKFYLASGKYKFKIEYYFDPTFTNSTILIHGFNDFHYNDLLSKQLLLNKSNVFLLTLRNYDGMQQLEPQFYINNLKKYFIEINTTIELITSLILSKIHDIYLMGHSTGGLTSIAYCYEGDYKSKITKLILNSPFLDFNNSCIEEFYLKTIGQIIGYFFPLSCLNKSKLDNSFPSWINDSISKELQTNDLIENINVKKSIVNVSGKYNGWMYAVRHYHLLIQNRMINLNIPIYVFQSNKNGVGGDNTLNVSEISKYSSLLSKNKSLINHYYIKNGLHNVFSSNNDSRKQAFDILNEIYNSQTNTTSFSDL